MERHRDTQHAEANINDGDDTDVSTEKSYGDTEQVRQSRDHVNGNITVYKVLSIQNLFHSKRFYSQNLSIVSTHE